jgi:hypothetical protein
VWRSLRAGLLIGSCGSPAPCELATLAFSFNRDGLCRVDMGIVSLAIASRLRHCEQLVHVAAANDQNPILIPRSRRLPGRAPVGRPKNGDVITPENPIGFT